MIAEAEKEPEDWDNEDILTISLDWMVERGHMPKPMRDGIEFAGMLSNANETEYFIEDLDLIESENGLTDGFVLLMTQQVFDWLDTGLGTYAMNLLASLVEKPLYPALRA